MTPSDDIATAAEAMLMVENAALPLVVVLPDGRVAMANRALRELLGCASQELADRMIWELLADADSAERWWGEFIVSRATGAPARVVHLRGCDGRAVSARSATIIVADAAGDPRLVIGSAVPV